MLKPIAVSAHIINQEYAYEVANMQVYNIETQLFFIQHVHVVRKSS